MPNQILLAWIGKTDLDASQGIGNVGLGPIARAVTDRQFKAIHLLSNYPETENRVYEAWLKTKTASPLTTRFINLTSPTNFGEIYEAAVEVIQTVLIAEPKGNLVFHLSPGTPMMAAVWIIIGKTRYPAELIQSDKHKGVVTASVPFAMSAEYLPNLLAKPDDDLERLSRGLPPEAPEFDEIIYRSQAMTEVITKARYIAPRSIPVLILGESGTGKELLARAIHQASPRKDKPFIPVNCGAIPETLVESELFGYGKGAFTGATKEHKGYFETAHEGTIFLDEVGELPLPTQVKLLRVLQERKVSRVGSISEIPVNVRVISATNRNLIQEISEQRFRDDLFYRLGVAILKIPPIRERQGDLSLLIDKLWEKVNQEASESEPGFKLKQLSPAAKNLLLNYSWPGNVRELMNVLTRAAVWSPGEAIREKDIQEALIPMTAVTESNLLNLPLEDGFSLHKVLDEVTHHYLRKAMEQAQGKKTEAAKLLGLPNYQTLTNWLKKFESEEG
ncbi:MAG: sigma 54-interacting transcriptional regulator [Blastocatellia bacterium]|nr:sigma 54-interacting transcriptional regulator [Blastocatellia bacterium]